MGLVYLLECTNDDHTVYKIGYTKNTVQKRIKALQTGNSYIIKELCKYETKYHQKLERAVQNHYKHHNLNLKGEWYNLELSDITSFISTCERIEKNFEHLKDNPFFTYPNS